MSWSVGAIGKSGAVKKEISEQFNRGGKCIEPEETIRQQVASLLDDALDTIHNSFVVKVQASGSQGYKDYSAGVTGGVHNNLSISIEVQHNFVE